MAKHFPIVCDVDGVLLDFAFQMSVWALAKHDLVLDPDPDDWSFGIKDEKTLWSLVGEMWASSDFSQLPLYCDPSDVEAVNAALASGDMVLVTAVPPKYHKARLDNLRRHGFLVPDGQLVCRANKMPYILDEVKPCVAIEDSPKNLKSFYEADVPTFCPAKARYAKLAPGSQYGPTQKYSSLTDAIRVAKGLCSK